MHRIFLARETGKFSCEHLGWDVLTLTVSQDGQVHSHQETFGSLS